MAQCGIYIEYYTQTLKIGFVCTLHLSYTRYTHCGANTFTV